MVSARAEKLSILCFQNIKSKADILVHYCVKNKIDIKQVVYIGNDINDKDVMEIVGYGFFPVDVHQSIKEMADHVLSINGGFGVITELLDVLLNE